ncbi:MAG: acyl-CoA/acyl-ACP dehydrogenase [Deltaproteobacteria bacterium]|jgi:alkylation response protein AidB-like acyl-CoA dehydrogenase|nr:acyl-CoA/acyl-ACP dehydrogenase [Deltaproteobacteria bacterium]
MNFDFSDEQKLLQQTARDFLAEHSPLSVCREILESDQTYAASLWKGDAEMGWQGAAVAEQHGGAGFGHLELAMIAYEVGRALAPIPFGSSVYVATEAVLQLGSEAQQAKWLPRLASGEIVGTFALVEKPGQNAIEGVTASVQDGKLSGTKSPVADGDVADLAVVAAREAGGLGLYLVELDGPGVSREPLDSFDPSRSQARLRFDSAPAEKLTAGDAAGIGRLLDRAAVLMAFEQVGAAERAFEITHEFILGRYAFGKPIAAFQGIKHRMADLWCEIEIARSNAYYAAWALENDGPELAVAACLARVAASEAFEHVTVEMVQLHGGVGYTWEYDCHLFYRRAKLLSAMLGTPRYWKNLLIDRLQAEQAA